MMSPMGTRLTHQMPYDAPPDAVWEMLHTPAFRERVCEEMRMVRHDVRVAGPEVTIEQVQRARGIPSFATRFVGDEVLIVQHERWQSTRAEVTVTIPDQPGEMSGTADLTPTGAGTLEVVEMDVRVRVPVVGGRIEDLLASLLRKALETEHRVGREWLAGRG